MSAVHKAKEILRGDRKKNIKLRLKKSQGHKVVGTALIMNSTENKCALFKVKYVAIANNKS